MTTYLIVKVKNTSKNGIKIFGEMMYVLAHDVEYGSFLTLNVKCNEPCTNSCIFDEVSVFHVIIFKGKFYLRNCYTFYLHPYIIFIYLLKFV